MKKPLLFLFGILFSSVLHSADPAEQVIGPFGPLNNRDNSATIPDNYAQDLLNVDLTPQGRSFKKRKGFGLVFALTNTTSSVHGMYDFYDNTGNDIALVFNDTKITASVSGGAATVILSTGTNGATYQCTDSQGFAYCADSSRGAIIKTNGATYSNIYPTNNGTMISATPDRLVLAGFTSRPSDIDFSAGGDFTNWVTGVANTSPFSFTVVAPGSGIKHITYAFNRIIWFKDASFGYVLPGQTPATWIVRTISPVIGTQDNSSVYWEGILYWRGQDGHIYAYDGSSYKKVSPEIAGTIALSQRKNSNSWTQTTVADFDSGSLSGEISVSTAALALTANSTYFQITNKADFAAMTFDDPYGNADYNTDVHALQMTFPDLFTLYRDGSAGTKNVWTFFTYNGGGTGVDGSASVGSGILSVNHLAGDLLTSVGFHTTNQCAPYQQGTTYYVVLNSLASSSVGSSIFTFALSNSAANTSTSFFQVLVKSTTSGYGYLSGMGDDTGDTFSGSPSARMAFPITLQLYIATTTYALTLNGTAITNGTHTWSNKAVYVYYYQTGITASPSFTIDTFDVFPTSFTFTSPSYDSGFIYPVWGKFQPTNPGSGTSIWSTAVSANNSTFDAFVTVAANATITSAPKQYIKCKGIISDNQFPLTIQNTIQEIDFGGASSGTFKSAVHFAQSLGSWDSFLADTQANGGSNTFYIRASTGAFSVNSSTPAWTTIISGSIPTVSTGTYFQVKDDIIGPASGLSYDVNYLYDFVVNWFEGFATDKSYATYFNDAIWFSITYGPGITANNRILKYDLLNNGWLLYDLASNGFFVRNNHLYFGDSAAGNVYKFGDVDNDNGAAINAYWKSKDFIGSSPFQNDEYRNISIYYVVQNSSATVTYTVNGSSSSSYVMNMYTNSQTLNDSNRNLPNGIVGNSINVKVGNNAVDQPFEVMAERVGMNPKPWNPTSQ